MPEKVKKDFFIHREISQAWFQALSECGSTYVHTGIVLRFWLFYEKSDKISASSRKFEKFGISKFQKLRALRKLADRGLIKLEQQPGSNPRVMVVDPPSARSN